MSEKKVVLGYLPDERPPFGKLVLYALQQVIVMFPATVAVAIFAGFPISTTIFASGLATLCFILITGGKIPLYYGSSFSYITAVSCVATIQEAQFGIIMSGLVSIAAGFIVMKFGKDAVEKILPGSVSGSVAMVIGLTLAANAMADAVIVGENATPYLIVSLVTLLSTVIYSRYLKGFLGQLPLLLGALTGCAAAFVVKVVGNVDLFKPAVETGLFALPEITLPKFSMEALVGIMPVAIATIPESTAHMYQLDVYINDLAKKKGSDKKYDMVSLIGRNLIGDGLCDMIAGFVGGPAGTNYGENISTMAITKVFSVPVLVGASIIAMLISCFTPLINAISAIPTAVIGGLEVYLFGAIAAQGIAIMIDKKVDMFDSKNIAVIAIIMIVGVGAQYAFGGVVPMFGMNVPGVACASISGILINALLSIGEKKRKAE